MLGYSFRFTSQFRAAYHESVQLGQELSKRYDEDVSSGGKVDERTYNEDDDDDDNDAPGASRRAARKIREVLADSSEPVLDGKYKKLFDMDFMKKAKETRHQQARDEANSILKELSQLEGDYDSDDEHRKRDAAPTQNSSTKGRSAREKELLAQAKTTVSEWVQGDGSMTFKIPKSTSEVRSEPHYVGRNISQGQDIIAQAAVNPWISESALNKRNNSAANQNKVYVPTTQHSDQTTAPVSVLFTKQPSKQVSEKSSFERKEIDRSTSKKDPKKLGKPTVLDSV